jgi:hypothetical protein
MRLFEKERERERLEEKNYAVRECNICVEKLSAY